MTPGQYLYLQRRAAALSRFDVALRIDTYPPIAAAAREKLLASLEASLTPMRPSDAHVLARIEELRIDVPHLLELIAEADQTVLPIRPVLVAIGGEAPR